VGVEKTGAEILLHSLKKQGVDTLFGYPGGAVLPIYDALYLEKGLRHILVRHEQAAIHAALGYARSTGRIGVVLVTSGPGVTNTITGIAGAMADSVPVVILSGQVPTFMIGLNSFQEVDVVEITKPCTKKNWLVKDVKSLALVLEEAFFVAGSGRPGPVLVDIPKDVQIANTKYDEKKVLVDSKDLLKTAGDREQVDGLVKAIELAEKPLFYTGGGVVNSGSRAITLLRELVKETGFPITSTLMGLGSYPASEVAWLGMLGMHGLYEANMAMHHCDLLINVGARFDDRITGRIDAFSPYSKKAHIDIDSSSINKIVNVHIPIVGDVELVLEVLLKEWVKRGKKFNSSALQSWWQQINQWRACECLKIGQKKGAIKPQYALSRLEELTKHRKDRFVSTEVGQHQMWAAQYIGFHDPRQWLTSGGLGSMGYGFPASIGAQVAHPEALVINVAGEASWIMCMQELGTLAQYQFPVKQFILNNNCLGMVRQWQELLFGERYSHSSSRGLPDFMKLADSFGVKGIRCACVDNLDDAIREMILHEGPVIFECIVEKGENCFPMIPPGNAHNDMLLGF
jgi:acetolactate synthase-1/2/3 large subunit